MPTRTNWECEEDLSEIRVMHPLQIVDDIGKLFDRPGGKVVVLCERDYTGRERKTIVEIRYRIDSHLILYKNLSAVGIRRFSTDVLSIADYAVIPYGMGIYASGKWIEEVEPEDPVESHWGRRQPDYPNMIRDVNELKPGMTIAACTPQHTDGLFQTVRIDSPVVDDDFTPLVVVTWMENHSGSQRVLNLKNWGLDLNRACRYHQLNRLVRI